MPELRIDPICGRRVYIAEDRAGRPNDYERLEQALIAEPPATGPRYRADCPFCAGNEAITPDAAATVLDADGRWRVRVVPNKYPAVSLAAACGLAREGEGRAKPQAALGVHEVIVESPQHVTELAALDADQLVAVLATYRDRLRRWVQDARLRYALVFKNSGHGAGASLAHIHSQLVALPYVPAAVQTELDGAARWRSNHGLCAFCAIVERERSPDSRLVLDQGGYLAACAYYGRQPFETWILPVRHAARFDELDDGELAPLAAVLQGLVARLAAACRKRGYPLAYNLVLHTGPFDGAHAESYHWHWELIPRVTHLAGLEWGTGVFVNPVSPERAARELRAIGG